MNKIILSLNKNTDEEEFIPTCSICRAKVPVNQIDEHSDVCYIIEKVKNKTFFKKENSID